MPNRHRSQPGGLNRDQRHSRLRVATNHPGQLRAGATGSGSAGRERSRTSFCSISAPFVGGTAVSRAERLAPTRLQKRAHRNRRWREGLMKDQGEGTKWPLPGRQQHPKTRFLSQPSAERGRGHKPDGTRGSADRQLSGPRPDRSHRRPPTRPLMTIPNIIRHRPPSGTVPFSAGGSHS